MRRSNAPSSRCTPNATSTSSGRASPGVVGASSAGDPRSNRPSGSRYQRPAGVHDQGPVASIDPLWRSEHERRSSHRDQPASRDSCQVGDPVGPRPRRVHDARDVDRRRPGVRSRHPWAVRSMSLHRRRDQDVSAPTPQTAPVTLQQGVDIDGQALGLDDRSGRPLGSQQGDETHGLRGVDRPHRRAGDCPPHRSVGQRRRLGGGSDPEHRSG